MRSPSIMRLLCLALALLCVEQAAAGSQRPIGTMRKRSLAEQQPEFASDRVIVSFKPDVVRAMAAEEEGLQFQKPAGLQGALVYSIQDNSTVEEKIKQLEHHPAVALVEPDYKVKVFWDPTNPPDDPNYSQEWHIPKISAMAAWRFSTGSSEVKVCHVDSGVRIDHPDLSQNVLKGWNFVPAGQVEGSPPPRAGTPDYFNYNDTYGHGTHTAGIIGAVGNNALGIAGLNWNVKLLVCRFIWNDGSGYVSDAMNCIKLCRQEGAMITSNSWGGIGYSSFLEREIASTQAAGQLFVVASGNSGVDLDAVPLYPTSYKTDNMISVASSGANDYVSTFSNLGVKTVHMLAPGEAIFSTFMDGGYKQMWGTSMACPMVAGTAALLQARAMSRGVTLGYADLKKLIIETVDKVPDGADKVITGGRLNVAAAMLALEAMLDQRGAQPAAGQPALPAPEEGAGGGNPQEPAVVSPPPDGSESPPPPPPMPSPAAPPGKVCGGSPLAGLNSASQSSTSGTSKANFAIDGDCIKRRVTQGSCAQTLYEPNPWWAVRMDAPRPVLSVAIQTTSECACVADLVGARILVGTQPWEGPASAANFTLCSGVTGIVRGQRKSFACATGADGVAPVGQFIAIWRPSAGVKQLTLCEVDVELGPETQAPSAPAAAVQQPAAAIQQPGATQQQAAAQAAAAQAAAARPAASQQPAAAQAAAAQAAAARPAATQQPSAAAIQAAVDAEAAAQLRRPAGGAALGGRRRLRGVVEAALTHLKRLGGSDSEAADDMTS